jgi:hypothetical protein
MASLERIEGDLRFVRGALESSSRPQSPASVYFLWAVLVLIGFSLVDFQRSVVPLYWKAAGPAGFAVSVVLGWRHGRRSGQLSAADGRRHVLHWGAVLIVTFLAALMPARGVLPWASLNTVILLLLALGYFTAGVHTDPSMLWVGVLIAAGYVIVMSGSAYAWTMVGVSLALGLAAAGLRGGRAHAATS